MGILRALVRDRDMRGRLLFTLAAFAAYRLAFYIPVPGLDPDVLSGLAAASGSGRVFASPGGFSVVSLGIMPFLNASIILTLVLAPFGGLPLLSDLKDGPSKAAGRRSRRLLWLWLLAVVLALVQGYGLVTMMAQFQAPFGSSIVSGTGFMHRAMMTASLAAGSLFLAWLGMQVTERGIGNGIALMLFGGLAMRFFDGKLWVRFADFFKGDASAGASAFLPAALLVVLIVLVVLVETARRGVRVSFGRDAADQELALSLDRNAASVLALTAIPMTAPLLFAQFSPDAPVMQTIFQSWRPGAWAYDVVDVLLIFVLYHLLAAVFCYPKGLAKSIERFGGSLGSGAAGALEKVLGRVTLFGALQLIVLVLLARHVLGPLGLPSIAAPMYLLPAVAVGLDVFSQLRTCGRLQGRGCAVALTMSNDSEAGLIKAFLRSRGIDAHLFDECICRMHPLLTPALGGIRVAVPRGRLEEARKLVAGREGRG